MQTLTVRVYPCVCVCVCLTHITASDEHAQGRGERSAGQPTARHLLLPYPQPEEHQGNRCVYSSASIPARMQERMRTSRVSMPMLCVYVLQAMTWTTHSYT